MDPEEKCFACRTAPPPRGRAGTPELSSSSCQKEALAELLTCRGTAHRRTALIVYKEVSSAVQKVQ